MDYMRHYQLARDSEDYCDYLDAVATELDPREVLAAILWHMDEDDKRNILEPALTDCDFDLLSPLDYFDYLAYKKFGES